MSEMQLVKVVHLIYYCILKKDQKSNFYGKKAWKTNLFRFSIKYMTLCQFKKYKLKQLNFGDKI